MISQHGRDAGRRARVVVDQENARGTVDFIFGHAIDCAGLETAGLTLTQFGGDRIVAHQGVDARIEQEVVDRLGEEILRTRIKAADTVFGIAQRRYHDHRDVAGYRISFQAAADFVTVHAGHHNVEQDNLRVMLARHLDRLRAIAGENDGMVLRLKLCLEQTAVRLDIVDNQDPGTHAVAFGIRASTARMKDAI